MIKTTLFVIARKEKKKKKKKEKSKNRISCQDQGVSCFNTKGLLGNSSKFVFWMWIEGMFPYAWPFEFNWPTNVLSFVAKPNYNPKRPFDPCFYAFWNDNWMDI